MWGSSKWLLITGAVSVGIVTLIWWFEELPGRRQNVTQARNLTRNAVEGLSEQLALTSLMTVQNRMALYM